MGSSRPAANKEPRRGAAAASRVQSGREGAERSSAAGTRAGRGRRGEPGARGTASPRGAAPVVSLRTLTAPGAAPGKDGGRKAPAGPAQPHVLPTRAPHGGLRAQDVVCVCVCVCMYVYTCSVAGKKHPSCTQCFSAKHGLALPPLAEMAPGLPGVAHRPYQPSCLRTPSRTPSPALPSHTKAAPP